MSISSDLQSKLRHAAWNARRRCINTLDAHYEEYGGRGIEFRFQDVPSCVAYLLTLPGHDDLRLWIDRINNDGHYEVGNIRFNTRGDSQRNRRRSKPPNEETLVQYLVRCGFHWCFTRMMRRGLLSAEVAKLYCVSRNTVNRAIGRHL